MDLCVMDIYEKRSGNNVVKMWYNFKYQECDNNLRSFVTVQFDIGVLPFVTFITEF